MRTVRDPERLPAELAAARREAAAAFGDERVILERLVEGARHVEIQVLFDAHGHGVHLGERDCSIQRRHQKVLEEAGSPAVDAALAGADGRGRARDSPVTSATWAPARASSCSTTRGAFTFLEMNTRLQVEHPVTEAITGRDLVDDQLRIASRRAARLRAARTSRSTATRSRCGSTPRTPRPASFRRPGGSSACAGRAVPASASMPASSKATRSAVGSTRCWPRSSPTAPIAPRRWTRLTEALDRTVVLGLTTNLRFLRWLVREPVVRRRRRRAPTRSTGSGRRTTGRRGPTLPTLAWSTAATLLTERSVATTATTSAEPGDPWIGGWRLNGPRTVRLVAEGEERVSAAIADLAAPRLGAVRGGDTVHVDVAGRSVAFRIAPPPDVDRAAAGRGVVGDRQPDARGARCRGPS